MIDPTTAAAIARVLSDFDQLVRQRFDQSSAWELHIGAQCNTLCTAVTSWSLQDAAERLLVGAKQIAGEYPNYDLNKLHFLVEPDANNNPNKLCCRD